MGTDRCRGSLVALLLGLAVATSAASSAQVPKLLLNSPPDEIPGAYWQVHQLTRVGGRLAFADRDRGVVYSFDPDTRHTVLLFDPGEGRSPLANDLMGGEDEDLFVNYLQSSSMDSPPLGGTDGTFSGSRRVAWPDLPGVEFASPVSLDSSRQARNRHLFFRGYEADWQQAIWASDATAEGTFRISNPTPLGEAEYCEPAPMMTDELLFPIERIDGSTELWVSNGTAAGSFFRGSTPFRFSCSDPSYSLDSRALYPCSTTSGERGLCSTDGTPAGTEFLDVMAQTGFSGDGNLAYFRGSRDGVGSFWRSDGTALGTFPLAGQVIPGLPASAQYVSAAVARGLVIRTAPASARYELWVLTADGLDAEKLVTLCADPVGCAAATLGEIWQLDGLALFFAHDREAGIRLWSSDGTREGTRAVMDLNGIELYEPFIGEDGRWYAVGRTPELGEELYVSDGTPGGSLRLTDLVHASALTDGGAGSPEVAVLDDRVWFAAAEATTGRQLYSAAVSAAGARQETRWVLAPGGYVGQIGGRPDLFGIDRPCGYANQGGVWISDGTPERTTLGLALTPFDCGGFPLPTTGAPFAWGAGLALPWRTSANRYQLFWFSALGQEPIQVTDFANGNVTNPAQVGSSAVYPVDQFNGPWELWASDTPDSPGRFLASLPGDTTIVSRPQRVSTLALFATELFQGPVEVFRTDSTAAGTFSLGLSAGGLSLPQTARFTVTETGDRSFFILIDADLHGAIWETDGTVANTRRFTSPTLRVLWFLQPAYMDGRIVFAADEDGQPSGLYAQALDSAAAQRLTDLAPASPTGTGAYLTLAAATSSRVFVTGFDAEGGQELWSANASGGPFTRLRDIAPGSRSSHPTNLTVVGDRLLFSANDDVHGRELWISDGTSAGTRMIWEVAQGGFSSFPSSLTAIGTDLVFSASHPLIGQEVWILHLGPEAPGLIFDDNFESGSTAQWERSPL